jgi:hypothetical protein
LALLASWVLVIPNAIAQSPLRACDKGEKKLSFGVYFRDKWHGSVNKTAALAEFSFGDTDMSVTVQETSGDPSDVRVTLDDMLEMPLLDGEKYRLCFSVQASKSFTAFGRFMNLLALEAGQPLQTPETCTFQINAGQSDQSCEFVALRTTESEEFVFLLGEADPGTEIRIKELKLYILK